MDVFLLTKVTIAALVILLSGETSQTVFVDIHSQWINRSQGHIDSHVKFVAIYEQRLADILTDDCLCSWWDLINILSDENALSLTGGSRFANP